MAGMKFCPPPEETSSWKPLGLRQDNMFVLDDKQRYQPRQELLLHILTLNDSKRHSLKINDTSLSLKNSIWGRSLAIEHRRMDREQTQVMERRVLETHKVRTELVKMAEEQRQMATLMANPTTAANDRPLRRSCRDPQKVSLALVAAREKYRCIIMEKRQRTQGEKNNREQPPARVTLQLDKENSRPMRLQEASSKQQKQPQHQQQSSKVDKAVERSATFISLPPEPSKRLFRFRSGRRLTEIQETLISTRNRFLDDQSAIEERLRQFYYKLEADHKAAEKEERLREQRLSSQIPLLTSITSEYGGSTLRGLTVQEKWGFACAAVLRTVRREHLVASRRQRGADGGGGEESGEKGLAGEVVVATAPTTPRRKLVECHIPTHTADRSLQRAAQRGNMQEVITKFALVTSPSELIKLRALIGSRSKTTL